MTGRGQCVQVVGPGPAKRHQSRKAQAPGLGEVMSQLEGFVAGRRAAGPVEAQQRYIAERDTAHRRVRERTQQRFGSANYGNPTLFLASTCSAR